LLAPTRLYVKPCLAALRVGGIKALAHITGGGLVENIPRVLPKTLAAELDAASWPLPPVFQWLARTAGLDHHEMARTFNCGIERARQAGVTATVIPHRDFSDRESFDAALDDALRRAGVELLCTAGFMRILTAWFVERWRDRQINIHPSLLPAFPGLHTHERA